MNDHAATPVHLDNSTPIDLNIGGDMDLVFLVAPEAAQINVGGNMNNCGFQGMNLSANDVTSINVDGAKEYWTTRMWLTSSTGASPPLI